jgi:hypothetical protein
MKLRALIRSGAVSTSVPSRSKTMVGVGLAELEFMGMRYPSRRDYARRTGRITTKNDGKIGRKSAEKFRTVERGIDA